MTGSVRWGLEVSGEDLDGKCRRWCRLKVDTGVGNGKVIENLEAVGELKVERRVLGGK